LQELLVIDDLSIERKYVLAVEILLERSAAGGTVRENGNLISTLVRGAASGVHAD
jgi:hypothetical protein